MIDFEKVIKNSDKFREPALTFKKYGSYCSFPAGTTEYLRHWDQETKRCIDGYTAKDGDWVSGYYYFYLNYCPILRLTEETYVDRFGKTKTRRVRDREFPDFYDYDYYYFLAVQLAEDSGKHIALLKARGKGYSFKGGSMLCRNYFLIPESRSIAVASEQEYLTKDGLLTKAWEFMEFIDQNTAWTKKRQKVDTRLHRRASLVVTDEFGNKQEVGYKSEILGVTLKNNPDRIRGKRAKLILWEEAGMFKDILQAWQIARPSVEEDNVAFGLMIAWGTGGSEGEDFYGLRELFYQPDGYNIQSFPNIWDDSAGGTTCGFFVPTWTNMSTLDEAGNRIFMDKDGNSLREKSIVQVLHDRQNIINNAKDSRAVDRFIAERPNTPQEACLELTGNIFPKKDLQNQLALLRTNKALQNHKQVGDLLWSNGELLWVPKKYGDLTKYELSRTDDPTGAIVIWEHPVKDAPHGLYIAGLDPYDHDQSGTNSLGSCFIYKRFLSFEDYYDVIVAEYTGRPATAEDYYENVRKLLIYYNAKCLYENERKGIFPYFTQKHCDYLLADQPDIISDIIGDSKVNRKKGIHMTKQIKAYGEGLIKDWLNEEYAPGKKNLTKILSEPLLEELIRYNDKGNFDRCCEKGTKITTDIGMINIENIKVGDNVLTHTGRFRKVLQVDISETEDSLYEIHIVGNPHPLVVTGNHPILSSCSRVSKHKYRKKYIEEGVQWRTPLMIVDKKSKYNFAHIPKRLSQTICEYEDDFLYLLGWCLADGSINGNAINICFDLYQENMAIRVANIVNKYSIKTKGYTNKPAKITKHLTETGGHILVNKTNFALANKLKELGCINNNKKIDKSVLNCSNLLPLVIGYLEGDGHMKKNATYDGYKREVIECSTIYHDLLLLIRLILTDNGIWSSVSRVKHVQNRKDLLKLSICGNEINKLLSSYPSLKYKEFVPRKIRKETAISTKDGYWVPIKKIVERPSIKQIVYNLEVEGDHSYIANGVSVHNCIALIMIMIYRELLYHVHIKGTQENTRKLLFDTPLFGSNWFNSPSTTEDGIPLFSF